MIIRIARIFTLVLLFDLLLGAGPAIGEGWWSPKVSSESKTKTKKVPPKQTNHQTSTLDKFTASTKKFFSDVGNTLTFKKSSPQKTTAPPSNPWIKPPKNEPSNPSWLTSFFHPEEPKKPRTPSEWLEQKRLDP